MRKAPDAKRDYRNAAEALRWRVAYCTARAGVAGYTRISRPCVTTVMSPFRILLVALIAASACPVADAQWKWRDGRGAVQYSDVPPPQGTPDKDILERPRGSSARIAPVAAAPASASAASATTGGPVPTGVDADLEAKRRKAEIERIEKENKAAAARKADEERVAMVRADNCKRATSALKSLEDGVRLSRTNEKGEREVLDDKARAEETARMRQVISADCVK